MSPAHARERVAGGTAHSPRVGVLRGQRGPAGEEKTPIKETALEGATPEGLEAAGTNRPADTPRRRSADPTNKGGGGKAGEKVSPPPPPEK